MNTNIVSVKYEDEYAPKTFNGKSYSYYTNIDVNIGDLVIAPTAHGEKVAIVTEINIPEHKIEMIKPYLKTIETLINKEIYLYNSEILKETA